MSKGFNGMPGNLQAMMQQAQKMQEQMQKVHADSEKFVAEGKAGGGVVTAVATGKMIFSSIKISKEAVNPDDIGFLEELVLNAVNSALQEIQERKTSAIAKVTGGMGIPGLF